MRNLFNIIFRRILYKVPLKLLLVVLAVVSVFIACFSKADDSCSALSDDGKLPAGGYISNAGTVANFFLGSTDYIELGSGYRDYNRLVCVYFPYTTNSSNYRNQYTAIYNFRNNLYRNVFDLDSNGYYKVYQTYCMQFEPCQLSKIKITQSGITSNLSSFYFAYKVIVLDQLFSGSSLYYNAFEEGSTYGYDQGFAFGFGSGYNSGFNAGYSSGSSSCPSCPDCPSCPSCDDPYTSLECQTEYNLIPISSVDQSYCVNNNLCPSSSCPDCPSYTGDLLTGVSNLFINNLFHPGAYNLFINIPDEIDRDYAYTNNGSNFNLDIVGYNQDNDYINSIVDLQNYKPNENDLQIIISSIVPLFIPGLVIILLLYFIFRFIKKVF